MLLNLWASTCEDGEFLPFIALTAAYMARSVQIFLKDGKKIGITALSHKVIRKLLEVLARDSR